MQGETQNYELDRFKLITYRRIALGLLVIGAVVLAIVAVRGEGLLSPLSILGMVLMLAGAPFAYLADCVERKHDIETVREVQAFLDGTDPGQIERDRTSSRAMRLAKRTLVTVAVVALILAALCGVIALVTLR